MAGPFARRSGRSARVVRPHGATPNVCPVPVLSTDMSMNLLDIAAQLSRTMRSLAKVKLLAERPRREVTRRADRPPRRIRRAQAPSCRRPGIALPLLHRDPPVGPRPRRATASAPPGPLGDFPVILDLLTDGSVNLTDRPPPVAASDPGESPGRPRRGDRDDTSAGRQARRPSRSIA